MKNKIFTGIGILVFAIVFVLNISVAIDKDINNFFTPLAGVEVLALGSENGTQNTNNDLKEGPVMNTPVHCTKNIVSVSVTTTNNGSTTNWSAGGNANASWKPIGISAGGGYGSGSTVGNSTITVSTESITEEYDAFKYYCPKQSGSCTPFDPCK